MIENLQYDKSNPKSIESYAQSLCGKTFARIILENIFHIGDGYWDDTCDEFLENIKNKNRIKYTRNNLDELVATKFFHNTPSENEVNYFESAKLTLKVSPCIINEEKSVTIPNSLIISKISNKDTLSESFYESLFWKTAKQLLLVYYFQKNKIEEILNCPIRYVQLFSPSAEDLTTIINDYNTIVEKIKLGKINFLSSSDTEYVEVITIENQSSKSVYFAFKKSYMTRIINKSLVTDVSIKNDIRSEVADLPLEEHIQERIRRFKGKSIQELKEQFNIPKDTKSLTSRLIFKILGLSGNHASELKEAGIALKTIRIEQTGKIKEHMSFPSFKFKSIIRENWDTSTFRNYLKNTLFLFVIFKKTLTNEYILTGCQLWNIPEIDLDTHVKEVWRKTQNILLQIEKTNIKDMEKKLEFPKHIDDRICHVRPHAQNTADVDELPNGGRYIKQAFWLSNEYIASQLKKEFIE